MKKTRADTDSSHEATENSYFRHFIYKITIFNGQDVLALSMSNAFRSAQPKALS